MSDNLMRNIFKNNSRYEYIYQILSITFLPNVLSMNCCPKIKTDYGIDFGIYNM